MTIYVVFREEWINGELCEVMEKAYREKWQAEAFARGARAQRKDYIVRECFLY